MNHAFRLTGFLRARLLPATAIGLRIIASAAYLLLIWLISKRDGVQATADFIFLISMFYVTSLMGRVGTDQLISANAIHFRKKVNSRGTSILFTHLMAGIFIVSLSSFTLMMILQLLFGVSATLNYFETISIAVLFSCVQTFSTAFQARGNILLSVFVFPLLSWIVIGLWLLVASLSYSAYLLAFSLPVLIGLAQLVPSLQTGKTYFRRRWLLAGRHYYVMGVNFSITNWAPYLYLHAFVPAGELVLINTVARLMSLQAMPSNAAVQQFLPNFSMNKVSGRSDFNERIIGFIILLNIMSLILLILLLAGIYLFYVDLPLSGGDYFIVGAFFVANLVVSLLGPSGPVLSMMGAQVELARISTAIMLSGLISGILTTFAFGGKGYAIVFAVSTIVQAAIYTSLLNRRWGISGFRRAFAIAKNYWLGKA